MEDLLSICTPLIAEAEGLRLHPYKDTTGHTTIGYGHNIDAKGISKKVADLILQEDLNEAIASCKEKIDFFNSLSIPKKYVLVNMAFNMGIGGLLSFTRMLASIKSGDDKSAAFELSNSLESKQVPNRVFPLIKILETDSLGN